MMNKAVQKVVQFFRYTGEVVRNTHPVMQIAAFSLCALILFLLWISAAAGPDLRRTVFVFPEEYTGIPRTEIRYMQHIANKDSRLTAFLGELLLGPISPDLAPLFGEGTTLHSACIRFGHAYINLSASAFEGADESMPPDERNKLFKKNVCTNFRNVDKIHLYVEGVEVYSQNPFENASSK